MAYQTRPETDTVAAQFGTLRTNQIRSQLAYADLKLDSSHRLKPYFERSFALAKQGKQLTYIGADEYLSLEITTTLSHNTASVPVKLTKFFLPTAEPICWFHTEPEYFDIISAHVDECYNQLNQASANDSSAQIIDYLKIIARIHYFQAHMCRYSRGSAACAEIYGIAAPMLKLGLIYPRKTQEVPDAFAITITSPEEYVEKFPQIFACKTYAELLEMLPKRKKLSAEQVDQFFSDLKLSENLAGSAKLIIQQSRVFNLETQNEPLTAEPITFNLQTLAESYTKN